MHAVVLESLEAYLSGALEPAVQRQFEAHLSTCRPCREAVQGMQDVSQWFVSLRTEESWAASPGFYGAVMKRVGERTAVPSFSSLFALDLAFGRRLVFACLLTLAVLGSFLVSRESGYPGVLSPEAVMAQQNSPAFDTASAQDNMLVTLTGYEY